MTHTAPVVQWTEARGIGPGEAVSVAQINGGAFLATTMMASEAAHGIAGALAGSDVWVSGNPMRPGLPANRKGTAADVARLACIWADLDVKAGGMPSWKAARAVIADLSRMLGTAPAAIVMTGHGLQPVWAIEPGPGTLLDTEEKRAGAAKLLRRIGALVARVAAAHGGAVDNVFNLDRILRAPGTTNRKDVATGGVPIPTTLELPGGAPLPLEALREALGAYDVPEAPSVAPQAPRAATGAGYGSLHPEMQHRVDAYLARVVEDEARAMASRANWAEGVRDNRGRGWEKATSDLCLRLGQLARAEWTPWTSRDAENALERIVPEVVARATGLPEVWSAQRGRRSPAPWPDGLDAPRSEPGIAALVPAGQADPGAVVSTEAAGDLWAARPELAVIHDWARARMAAPLAVLGVTLARVVASVPPFVVLPPIVGREVSLNMFVAPVGASGSGKGAAEGAAAAAVDLIGGVPFPTVGAGSGEGLAHLYMTRTKDGPEQHTQAVLLSVAEIDTLLGLKQRQGSTLLPELRKAWTGEALGFSYADPAKRLPVPAQGYRLCLVVGVQPARAGTLLDDADGGTPQRFLWLPTADPTAPDVTPPPPGRPVPWTMPKRWPTAYHGLSVLPVCAQAVNEIRAARLARLKGEGDALDGHALLARLKVAAAFGLLAGRAEVADDDWALAGVMMRISDATRAGVQAELSRVAAGADEARGLSEGRREVIRGSVVEEAAQKKAGRAVVRKLRGEDGWISRGEVRRSIRIDQRCYFEDALEALVAAGQVEVEAVQYQGQRGARLRLPEGTR